MTFILHTGCLVINWTKIYNHVNDTWGESFLFYDNFSVYEEIYILINVIFDQDSNKCDQLFLTVEIRTSYEI